MHLAVRHVATSVLRDAIPVHAREGRGPLMNDPVTMRRKLRADLKRLRTAHALTQRNVAERLDWSQSKVIRIENGQVAVGECGGRAWHGSEQ